MQQDDFFCFQAISSPSKTHGELTTVKKKLQGEAPIQHGRLPARLLLEASTLYRSGREAGEELRLHHRP